MPEYDNVAVVIFIAAAVTGAAGYGFFSLKVPIVVLRYFPKQSAFGSGTDKVSLWMPVSEANGYL